MDKSSLQKYEQMCLATLSPIPEVLLYDGYSGGESLKEGLMGAETSVEASLNPILLFFFSSN